MVADRLLAVGVLLAQVRACRADGERERLPEVVEVRVLGRGRQRPRLHVLEPGAAQQLRDLAVAHADTRLLALGLRVDRARRAPERAEHRHAAARDIPHAAGDDAARPRDARHLARARRGVAHEREHERAQRDVERAVLERQLLGDADAHVGARVALAAGVGELLGGVDRGDVVGADAGRQLARQPARAAADVERAHAGDDPGGVGELDRQLRDVAAHEAVVVLGGSGELHPPSQPPPRAPRQAVRSADAHDGGPRDGGGPAPRPGRGAREGAQLPHPGRLQPADLLGAQHALQTARRDLRRHHDSISFRFRTPGGFRCKRVSGNALAGQWRCVKQRNAYRFEFSD